MIISGVNEVISDNFQATQEHKSRRKVRMIMVEERQAILSRKADLKSRTGSEWDTTREMFTLPEITLKDNDDLAVLEKFRHFRKLHPNIHDNYEILDKEVTSVSVLGPNV